MALTPYDVLFNKVVFGYQPSPTLCLIAIGVFGSLAIVLAIQNIRFKRWYMLLVTLTALSEAGGYVARYFLAAITSTRVEVIAMEVLLILSPNILALVNYWTVGLIVQKVHRANGGKLKGGLRWVRPRTLSALFLSSDFAAFGTQGAAASMVTNGNTASLVPGRHLMLIGLGVQMIFFTLFACITIYVHASGSFGLRKNKRIQPAFACLYITIILLTIRSIYRFNEFAVTDSYVATHEKFFYTFDTLVVTLSMLTYLVLPFGKYLDFEPETVDIQMAAMMRQSELYSQSSGAGSV